MIVLIYYAISTLIFYTAWYFSLGWFVKDESQRQNSWDFWFKKVTMQDYKRTKFTENVGVPDGKEYEIYFLRLLFAWLIIVILILVILILPINSELHIVLITPLVLLSPFLIIRFTNGEFVIYMVPIFWGILIGVTMIIWYITLSNSWEFNPQLFIQSLLGKDYKSILIKALVGIVPLLGTTIGILGYNKIMSWLILCWVIMGIGSFCIFIGLVFCNIL